MINGDAANRSIRFGERVRGYRMFSVDRIVGHDELGFVGAVKLARHDCHGHVREAGYVG